MDAKYYERMEIRIECEECEKEFMKERNVESHRRMKSMAPLSKKRPGRKPPDLEMCEKYDKMEHGKYELMKSKKPTQRIIMNCISMADLEDNIVFNSPSIPRKKVIKQETKNK